MKNTNSIDDNLDIYKNNITILLGDASSFETKDIINMLQHNKIYIEYFCDNNQNYCDKNINGIKLISPKNLTQLVKKHNNKIIVQFSTSNVQNSNLIKQLNSIGIETIISYEEVLTKLNTTGSINLSTIQDAIIDDYTKKHIIRNITFDELLSQSNKIIEDISNTSNDELLEFYNLLDLSTKLMCQRTDFYKATWYRNQFCKLLDEFLCYIIDRDMSLSVPKEFNMYTPTPNIKNSDELMHGWNNNQLMKDCGLTGYTLAKEIGATAHMLFCSTEREYPYSKLLPGLQLHYKDPMPSNYTANVLLQYLQENYQKIDMIILYGVYHFSMLYLDMYRKLRPDGIVYCTLDMSSNWMQQIGWNNKSIRRYTSQCDFIGTTCSSLCTTLNLNPDVNFTCRFISNGFYNPTNTTLVVEPSNKENIILTVARIGMKQKNTQELMIAFSKIADKIPDWTLRLVGNIYESFYPFIDDYFRQFPHLKERVILTGPITDKSDLYNEYAKAKIFALTSLYEGGSPNVYAEALVHGCRFITSDIDAADDIINYGELGVKYPINNTYDLVQKLLNMCLTEIDLDEHIAKCQLYANKYFDWNNNAKKIAFHLFR